MATVLNTMYPPQVETFMPSFCYNSSAKVWFNISSYNEDIINKIKFIHVSMVDQRNNENVFAGKDSSNNTVYPQYYPIVFNGSKNNNNNTVNKMGYDPNKKMYWLVVPPQVIKTTPYYNINQYYKIQLRFDLTGSDGFEAYSQAYENPTTFFYWNNSSSRAANALKLASYSNYNQDNFSEWSTGTLIKPILIPELSIKRFSSTVTNVNPSTDVQVAGKLKFNKANGDTSAKKEIGEQLSWYQIEILNNAKTIVLYNSNKIYINSKNAINEINYKVDMSMLVVNINYQMKITYETNNGYSEIIYYPIKVVDYTNTTNITCLKSIDEENGIVTLNISGLNRYSNGYLVVRRSSHYSNFNHWELIAAYDISSLNNLIIEDNTIESMTGYRYQLQYINGNIIYSPVYVENDDIIHCDFYGCLFSDKENMLRISFDFQLSNRANAVNRSKTDTLGGQYPVFTQNSKLKYHTYSISGRISTEDNGELFLPKQVVFGAEYYEYRYNSGVAVSPHTAECQSIKSGNDWLYEREYRDAVEEWLNNGKPKLFRSMTEGNMIVMLDGISMTPDIALGRRLYNFSATMYEIGNGKNLESIVNSELFDVIDERE